MYNTFDLQNITNSKYIKIKTISKKNNVIIFCVKVFLLFSEPFFYLSDLY